MRGTYEALKYNTFCVWWFGPTHYQLVRDSLRESGFSVSDIPCIWNKGNQGQTNHPEYNPANCYEPFFLARKGQPFLRKQGRPNVFSFDQVPAGQKIHPTERPLPLMVELLEMCSYPGQAIVVPFLGSGVTLRAAYRLGMSGCGWDLNQDVKNKFLLKVQEDAERDEHNREGAERDSNSAERPETAEGSSSYSAGHEPA
jgi:site-specific DNA-methyltransferase (adenine-specific)